MIVGSVVISVAPTIMSTIGACIVFWSFNHVYEKYIREKLVTIIALIVIGTFSCGYIAFKYEKFNAVDGNYLRKKQTTKEDKLDKEYFNKIIMMWNAGEKQKGNVVGCLLSHLRLMRKIISKKFYYFLIFKILLLIYLLFSIFLIFIKRSIFKI